MLLQTTPLTLRQAGRPDAEDAIVAGEARSSIGNTDGLRVDDEVAGDGDLVGVLLAREVARAIANRDTGAGVLRRRRLRVLLVGTDPGVRATSVDNEAVCIAVSMLRL